jgi:hypothetical protein
MVQILIKAVSQDLDKRKGETGVEITLPVLHPQAKIDGVGFFFDE